jgi:hypothetical protein
MTALSAPSSGDKGALLWLPSLKHEGVALCNPEQRNAPIRP